MVTSFARTAPKRQLAVCMIPDMKGTASTSSAQWPDYLANTNPGVWEADPMGPGFEFTTLNFGIDDEGPAVATLIRYRPTNWWRRGFKRHLGVVLSVHGWSDYFFNRQLAEFWENRGYHFYALDLRRFGRSLRAEHELPGFTADLREYDEDLNAALDVLMKTHPNLPVVAQGHSQGGLILSLWLARVSPPISALVLNAPWLEFQGTAFLRIPMKGIMEALSRNHGRRKLVLPEFDQYWRSLSNEAEGHWDIHRLWRPRFAFPSTAAWMKTVLEAHASVAKGLQLTLPILVLTSASSHLSAGYGAHMQDSDTVLDVHQVRVRALKLGRFVSLAEIPGAMHDVFTSMPTARTAAYQDLSLWLGMLEKSWR